MEVRQPSNSRDAKAYDTKRLREEFLIQDLFLPDRFKRVYSHIDRIITMGFMPVTKELNLSEGIDTMKSLGTSYFLERRELGMINIGGTGIVQADGVEYTLNTYDGLYLPKETKEVIFKSINESTPAKFYTLSAPAHKVLSPKHIDINKAKKVPAGEDACANKRVINQYLHPDVLETCQLTMGMTQLEPGNVWNTMPCHTHERRMEVYLYFNLSNDNVVFHMMGEGNETRHVVMRNEEAIISPSWSIHSGVGTSNYTFIWGMVGENQTFNDMDNIAMKDLY